MLHLLPLTPSISPPEFSLPLPPSWLLLLLMSPLPPLWLLWPLLVSGCKAVCFEGMTLMPTSSTTAPDFTQSARMSSGQPHATTRRSAHDGHHNQCTVGINFCPLGALGRHISPPAGLHTIMIIAQPAHHIMHMITRLSNHHKGQEWSSASHPPNPRYFVFCSSVGGNTACLQLVHVLVKKSAGRTDIYRYSWEFLVSGTRGQSQ